MKSTNIKTVLEKLSSKSSMMKKEFIRIFTSSIRLGFYMPILCLTSTLISIKRVDASNTLRVSSLFFDPFITTIPDQSPLDLDPAIGGIRYEFAETSDEWTIVGTVIATEIPKRKGFSAFAARTTLTDLFIINETNDLDIEIFPELQIQHSFDDVGPRALSLQFHEGSYRDFSGLNFIDFADAKIESSVDTIPRLTTDPPAVSQVVPPVNFKNFRGIDESVIDEVHFIEVNFRSRLRGDALFLKDSVDIFSFSTKIYTGDPFFSLTLTHFDADTGELILGGPNATFDSGMPSELPIIDVVIDSNGNLTTDPLLNALLDYSGIFLQEENNDGTFSFTDGSLRALNPSNPSDIFFSADIVDILANPNNSMFSAKLQNFVPGSISTDSSPLLEEFVSAGIAELWLDAAIMDFSDLFSQTGTTSVPFPQDGFTTVPEPSTILSLLTIGGIALGASKRKQS